MKPHVYEILRKHFPEKEYALMHEVRDAAGFGASRSADYMAMNLWPSRGLSLHGLEQKASRSDWMNELKKPEKADAIFKYCDFWWLFTTQEGVAKLEEIPQSWGWIEIRNGKIKVLKDAPKLNPCVMDRSFLACILKRAVSKDGFILESSIEERIRIAKETAESKRTYHHKQLEEEVKKIRADIAKFKEFTGIDITSDRWNRPNIEQIGEAVNFIAGGGIKNLTKELEKLDQTSDRIAQSIKKGLQTLTDTEENKRLRALKKQSDANYKLEL